MEKNKKNFCDAKLVARRDDCKKKEDDSFPAAAYNERDEMSCIIKGTELSFLLRKRRVGPSTHRPEKTGENLPCPSRRGTMVELRELTSIKCTKLHSDLARGCEWSEEGRRLCEALAVLELAVIVQVGGFFRLL